MVLEALACPWVGCRGVCSCTCQHQRLHLPARIAGSKSRLPTCLQRANTPSDLTPTITMRLLPTCHCLHLLPVLHHMHACMAISAHYGITLVPAHVTWSEDPPLSALRHGIQQARNASESGAISIQTHTPYKDLRAKLMREATIGGKPLLLFTSVRHPVSRVHSSFVQDNCQLAARDINPDPLWVRTQCQGSDGGNQTILNMVLQNDTLETRWEFVRRHPRNRNFGIMRGFDRSPRAVADMYDFIFVQERMAESVVAFMMEYGLRWEDVAHVPAKQRTGRYNTYNNAHELNAFIESRNGRELELWRLANLQLDRRIERLEQDCGAGVFLSTLCTYERLQRAVLAECGDWEQWYEQQGLHGEPRSRFEDQGIAPRCAEAVARRFTAVGQL